MIGTVILKWIPQGKQAAGVLEKLRVWTRSPVGRGRAFIRLSLNQRTIIEYLEVRSPLISAQRLMHSHLWTDWTAQALVWNAGLVQAFFTRGAFFRNEHLVTEMMEQLATIEPLQFSLTMHYANLDQVL